MRKRIGSKGWLWARTLYLLFAVALYWLSCAKWDTYLHGVVFVMAPWTVVLAAGGVARRQVRWGAWHILLVAAAAVFMLSALRNGNLTPRGLLVLALGFATAWLGVMGFAGDGASRRRGLYRLGFFVLAAALAVLLFATICRFLGHEEWLPWVTRKAASRGARSANNGELLLRNQKRTLRGLTALTYVCGAILVAGIVPEEADAAYLRRESRLLCLVISALGLVYLVPAVSTVFTGEPIWDASWMPSVVGIQRSGFITDRIWAFQHPNKGAMSAVMGILCALYVLRGTKRRWARALLVLMVILYLMALAHCQSRTSDIALGLGAGALVFREVWLRLAGKRRRWLVGFAAWGLTLALAVLLISGVFTVDVMVATRHGAAAEPSLLDKMREDAAGKRAADRIETEASDSAVEVSDGVVVSRTVAAGMLDVFSNGRDRIWREGMDYLIHHPADMLLGMGSGDILERMKEYNPERYNANHLHNGLLETLARGGVFMVIALIGALCLLAGPAVRALTAPAGEDPGMPVLAAIIGAFLAISLVEALLFADASSFNLLFFYAAGRIMRAENRA